MKPFKEAEGYARDLQAAYDHYRAYGPATAGKFLTAYEQAVAILQRSPFVCRVRRHGWRQMIIHQYPGYSIFYRELAFCWLLGGILSVARDPDVIQARLLVREIAEETGD